MHKADKRHLGKGLKAQGTKPYEEVYPGLKKRVRESTVGQDKLMSVTMSAAMSPRYSIRFTPL